LISCWSSFFPTGIASFGGFFIGCHHMYIRGGEQERIAPLLMQIWDEVPCHLKVKNGISDRGISFCEDCAKLFWNLNLGFQFDCGFWNLMLGFQFDYFDLMLLVTHNL
jgi:hypothetical protein